MTDPGLHPQLRQVTANNRTASRPIRVVDLLPAGSGFESLMAHSLCIDAHQRVSAFKRILPVGVDP